MTSQSFETDFSFIVCVHVELRPLEQKKNKSESGYFGEIGDAFSGIMIDGREMPIYLY